MKDDDNSRTEEDEREMLIVMLWCSYLCEEEATDEYTICSSAKPQSTKIINVYKNPPRLSLNFRDILKKAGNDFGCHLEATQVKVGRVCVFT